MSCLKRCRVTCSHRAAKWSLLKDVGKCSIIWAPAWSALPPRTTLHEKWRSSSGPAEYVRGREMLSHWHSHPDAKPSSDYLSRTTLVIFYHSENNSTPCQVSWTAREISIRSLAFLISYSTTHLALQYFPPIFLQITHSSIILNPLLCPQLYTLSWCDGWLCSLLAEATPWTPRGWDGGKFRGGWVGGRWKGGRWASCSSLQFLCWQGLRACSRDKGRTGEGEREEGSEQQH